MKRDNHSFSMTRRRFLATMGAGGLALTAGRLGFAQEAAPGGRKPNVVLIVADDLGYAELGCQGGKDVPTPNIDSIAANGVRFSNGYVSCPVCSPTRAGLMTGRYQQRFGHEHNPGPPKEAAADFGLDLNEKTIAERLKPLGYATGMVGKWHLGYKEGFQPLDRGFDEFYGFLGGAHTYLKAADATGAVNTIMRGREPVADMDYTTDAFTREAVDFIGRHKGDTFFLYLPYNAVHTPLDALQVYRDRFPGIADPKRRTFAAMLSALDDGVGKVLQALRDAALEENTLVFFISDNGGTPPANTSINDPLRAQKGAVFEGGIRVPFLFQWKGRVPAGKVYDAPAISLDIHATVLAVAGGEAPTERPLDGVNLLPFVTGANAAAPHDKLFWRFGDQSAARLGNWKLVKQPGTPPQLYNLADDISEKNDLAAKEPDKLAELETAYAAWDKEMIPPKWKQGDRNRRRQGAKPKRKKAAPAKTETPQPK